MFEWLMFWKEKPVIVGSKIEPDYSVKKTPEYRAITMYSAFWVQFWVPNRADKYHGGSWYGISFSDTGYMSVSFVELKQAFSSAEEACSVVKRLNAGENFFPEYDIAKYAVLDCDCLEPDASNPYDSLAPTKD